MCRLGPTVDKKVPGMIKEEGALPRNAAGKVDIPSLRAEGIHVGSSVDEPVGKPVAQAKCTQANVYNVLRDSGLNPRVQRGTDFSALLDQYGRDGGMGIHGEGFVALARTLLRSLRRRSRYSVDLVEVVAVLHARVSVIVQKLETPVDEGELDGLNRFRGGLGQLRVYRDFSAHVLRIAGGFRTEDVPALPSFYNKLPPPTMEDFFSECFVPEMDECDIRAEDGMDDLMLRYSKVGTFAYVRGTCVVLQPVAPVLSI